MTAEAVKKLEFILSGTNVSKEEFNEIIDLIDNYSEAYHQAKLKDGEVCIKCKKETANRGLGRHKLVCSDCWNSLCD